MPLVNNPDLPRHAGDLAKIKRKIAEYEAGQHQHAADGVPTELAVRAHENTKQRPDAIVMSRLEFAGRSSQSRGPGQIVPSRTEIA